MSRKSRSFRALTGVTSPTFDEIWIVGETVAKGDGQLRSGTEWDQDVGVKSDRDEQIERPGG